MNSFGDAYAAPASAADGGVWYGDDQGDSSAASAAPEQQGFSIPTTAQTNGGGPMRRGGGGSFNPMGRGMVKPQIDMTPATVAMAEKNELGYIIFAYNIGYQTDEAQLHTLFTPYGTVAKINVIQDFNTGMNKGYAFVTMPNQQEAEMAVNSLNGSSFNGNTLQVRFKTPKGQQPPQMIMPRGRGGMRVARGGGMMRGGTRGGMRGAPAAGGYRGGRGGMSRGVGTTRGRGRGAYSTAPSAYDSYGYPASAAGYEQYAAYDPNAYAAYADYPQASAAAAADPYAAYAAPAGSGYASYGAAGGW